MLKACFNRSGCRIPLEIKQATASRHTKRYDREHASLFSFQVRTSYIPSVRNTLTLSVLQICHHKVKKLFANEQYQQEYCTKKEREDSLLKVKSQ